MCCIVLTQLPGSLVAYYQQVGRAGRAVSAAVGVLMSGREDEEIQANFRATAFPFQWDIEVVLKALHSIKGLTEEQLEQHCNLRPRDIIRVQLSLIHILTLPTIYSV